MTNIWIPPIGVDLVNGDLNPFTMFPSPRFQAVLSDAGDGVASLAVSAPFAVPATYSRASTAYTRLPSGIWIQVAVNSPRSYYGTVYGEVFQGRYDGYLHEVSKTNVVLWSRDFTNAAWAKAGMTAAKDQVGIDGITDSASSLLATAPNGSASQFIGAGAGVFGIYIKRILGVGTVQLTRDNGGNWQDVTAMLALVPIGQWSPWPLITILGGASSTVGIRCGTTGDVIAVDMAQAEDNTWAAITTPIPTTNVSVTRAADSLALPSTNLFPSPASDFTITSIASSLFPGVSVNSLDHILVSRINAQNEFEFVMNSATFFSSTNSYYQSVAAAVAFAIEQTGYLTGAQLHLAARNSSITGIDVFRNGAEGNSRTGALTPVNAAIGSDIRIGQNAGGVVTGSFAQRNLCIYPVALSNEQILTL